MTWRSGLLVLLVTSVAMAGCLSDKGVEDAAGTEADGGDDQGEWAAYFAAWEAGENPDPPALPATAAVGPSSVVAVIDMGINPLHEAFQNRELTDPGSLPVHASDASTGQAPVYVPTHMAPEDPSWIDHVVNERTLYRFAGTNLLVYQASEDASLLEDDAWGHGTGMAGLVTKTAPNATIVLVQSVGGSQAEAMAWAAKQPWIDIIVTAFNCRLSGTPQGAHVGCPDAVTATSEAPSWSEREVTQASKQAWSSGKLLVAAAGNSPGFTSVGAMAGPPWVIAVGGADVDRQGQSWASSQSVDVLASYVNQVPDGRDGNVEGERKFVGTSGSAPVVAGVLAEALYQARRAVAQTGPAPGPALVDAGGVQATNQDVREAMNRSAEYWSTTEYDADALSEDERFEEVGVPVGPAPWVQMGWGYLDASHTQAIAESLLGDELGAKPAEAQAWMDALQSSRAAVWS